MSPRVFAQLPLVNGSNGNIAIHGRSAPTIGYRYEAEGELLVLEGATVNLEIAGYAVVAGVAGEDPYTLLFPLTAELVASLPLNTAIPFAAVDETTWGVPTVIWSGFLTVYGYQAAPP